MMATRFLIWLKGQYIGSDDYGNKYYQERFLFSQPSRPPRRWISYKNSAEASNVPSEWYGWLHFTHETPIKTERYAWQKCHQPNLTGTAKAYRPPHSAARGHFSSSPKRYEPWLPKD